MPVLEGALERAVDLAAAMDSRGYGRTGTVAPPRVRDVARRCCSLGLVGICVGVYALLDGGTPGALGLPLLVARASPPAVVGLLLAGRRSVRTRYRPDPWALPEWLVSAVAASSPRGGARRRRRSTDPGALVGPGGAARVARAAAAARRWRSLLAALAGLVAPRPPGMHGRAYPRPRRDRAAREEVAA